MQNRPKYTSKMLVEQTDVFQVWLYTYKDHRTVYVVPRNSNERTVVLKIGHMWMPVSNCNDGTNAELDDLKQKKS